MEALTMAGKRSWSGSRQALKFILPHHALHRFIGALVVFGILFLIVVIEDLSVDSEVDELANGHTCVDAHGVGAGYLQCPGVAEADIALAGSGVDVDAESAYARLALKERNGVVGFCILFRNPQIKRIGMEHKPAFGDLEVLNGVVPPRVQNVVFIDGQPLAQVYIVGIGAQAMPLKGFDNDLSLLNAFQYFLIRQYHKTLDLRALIYLFLSKTGLFAVYPSNLNSADNFYTYRFR